MKKTFFQFCLKSFLNRSWTLCGCICVWKQSRNVIFRLIFGTPWAGLAGLWRGVSPNSHKGSIWRRKSDLKPWKNNFIVLSKIVPKPFLNILRSFCVWKRIRNMFLQYISLHSERDWSGRGGESPPPPNRSIWRQKSDPKSIRQSWNVWFFVISNRIFASRWILCGDLGRLLTSAPPTPLGVWRKSIGKSRF